MYFFFIILLSIGTDTCDCYQSSMDQSPGRWSLAFALVLCGVLLFINATPISQEKKVLDVEVQQKNEWRNNQLFSFQGNVQFTSSWHLVVDYSVESLFNLIETAEIYLLQITTCAENYLSPEYNLSKILMEILNIKNAISSKIDMIRNMYAKDYDKLLHKATPINNDMQQYEKINKFIQTQNTTDIVKIIWTDYHVQYVNINKFNNNVQDLIQENLLRMFAHVMQSCMINWRNDYQTVRRHSNESMDSTQNEDNNQFIVYNNLKHLNKQLHYLHASINDYIRAVNSARLNILDYFILTPDLLLSLMTEISGPDNNLLKIPNETMIMKNMKIVVVHTPKALRLIVDLPFISNAAVMKIYQYIPIPLQIYNTEISYYYAPQQHNLIVDQNSSHYTLLSDADLLQCSPSASNLLNCPTPRTIFKSDHAICLFDIFIQRYENLPKICDLKILLGTYLFLFDISIANTFIYVTKGEKYIEYDCCETCQEPSTQVVFERVGLIKVNSNCKIINYNMKQSHKQNTILIEINSMIAITGDIPELDKKSLNWLKYNVKIEKYFLAMAEKPNKKLGSYGLSLSDYKEFLAKKNPRNFTIDIPEKKLLPTTHYIMQTVLIVFVAILITICSILGFYIIFIECKQGQYNISPEDEVIAMRPYLCGDVLGAVEAVGGHGELVPFIQEPRQMRALPPSSSTYVSADDYATEYVYMHALPRQAFATLTVVAAEPEYENIIENAYSVPNSPARKINATENDSLTRANSNVTLNLPTSNSI